MSGRIIQVVPEDLHLSATLVEGHAQDVQLGHASADAELDSAQVGLVGLSAAAIAAKATKWRAVTQALCGRLAEHSAAFHGSSTGYQSMEDHNGGAITRVGAQAGSALG